MTVGDLQRGEGGFIVTEPAPGAGDRGDLLGDIDSEPEPCLSWLIPHVEAFVPQVGPLREQPDAFGGRVTWRIGSWRSGPASWMFDVSWTCTANASAVGSLTECGKASTRSEADCGAPSKPAAHLCADSPISGRIQRAETGLDAAYKSIRIRTGMGCIWGWGLLGELRGGRVSGPSPARTGLVGCRTIGPTLSVTVRGRLLPRSPHHASLPGVRPRTGASSVAGRGTRSVRIETRQR